MKTAAPVVELDAPAVPEPGTNRFIPIVPNGRVCPITSLKHAALYRLLVHGPARRHVRVCNLRQPGQIRAQTLFHVGDMLAYLSRLAERQRAQNYEVETADMEAAA
jgi:hypothetical protein